MSVLAGLKHAAVKRIPALRLLKNHLSILLKLQGFGRSQKLGLPVDGEGRPIPWYTYATIEWLSQFDFSDKAVFEYGAGHSTLYWGTRAARVTSVEHDRSWLEFLQKTLNATSTLIHASEKAAYVESIGGGQTYDIVAIDGVTDWRSACVEAVLSLEKRPPFVIFDNADWFPVSIQRLRNAGYFEIDFNGFVALSSLSATTSVFILPEVFRWQMNRYKAPRSIGGNPDLPQIAGEQTS